MSQLPIPLGQNAKIPSRLSLLYINSTIIIGMVYKSILIFLVKLLDPGL